MKRIALLLLATVLCTNIALAQKNEVGVSLGYDWALTYQLNFNNGNSLDLGVLLPGKAIYPEPTLSHHNLPYNLGCFGTQVRAFYLWNFDFPVEGLSWYAGPGFYEGLAFSTNNSDNGVDAIILGSLNGKVGLKYMLPSAPIAFSFDWAPGLAYSNKKIYGEYASQVAFSWWTFGFGVRYLF